MQLSLAFAIISTLIATAIANPVTNPRPGFSLAARSEDGAYTFDQHGNITSFVPAAVLQRRVEERGIVEIPGRDVASADLSKRASTGVNCFNAGFSGSDKLNAVNAMFSLLDDYPVVAANGAIATQFGNAIVYVCNFNTVESQDANANDVHPEDNTINKKCGSSTAGRDRFSSGIEHGRTAAGKPFCDGS